MNDLDKAKSLKNEIKRIVDETIAQNELVRSAIKVKRAKVDSIDLQNSMVTVSFPFEYVPMTLPCNPTIINSISVGDTVSVWYTYGMTNAIVMQNGTWSL